MSIYLNIESINKSFSWFFVPQVEESVASHETGECPISFKQFPSLKLPEAHSSSLVHRISRFLAHQGNQGKLFYFFLVREF